MGRLNWSGFDGAEFESLVHSVLFFEAPNILLFGRPGKDSGQDAITSDRTHVYQAKYGATLTGDDAIKLAKAELKKIREYMRPDNSNYRFWSKVKQWTLVANFDKNNWDVGKWEREIIGKYSDLNLEFDFWDATHLEALLTKYPDVEQAYFNGRNRSFIGIWEAHRFLKRMFGEHYFGAKVYGRERQFEKLDKFVENPQCQFLIVHGQELIGKTRFLYESAVRLSEQGWRVFWGLPDSMSTSNAWMTGITGTNEKTCIVVDSPKNSVLVRSLYEQLSTIDKQTWKIIVSCQQYEFFDWFGSGIHNQDTDDVELVALSEDLTTELINELSATYNITMQERVANGIFALTKGVPGWVCLTLEYCRGNGNHLYLYPQLLKEVSERVRRVFSVWDGEIKERRLGVLRWICAWKTIVVENTVGDVNAIVAFLGRVLNAQPDQIQEDIKELAGQDLLACWGRNRRIYTAEPVLVRQHVLSEWLFVCTDDAYSVTASGRMFIQQLLNSEIPNKVAIIENLAELSTCYLGNEKRVSFFHPIVDELKTEAGSKDVVQQLAVFDWAKRIMAVDPEAALEIAIKLWDNPAPSKTIRHQYWGDQTVEHTRMLTEIPWFLYSLARQCRTRTLSVALWKSLKRSYQEENSGQFKAIRGQTTEELILRLLNELNSGEMFKQLAFDELVSDCEHNNFRQFDIVLAKGLLSSRREQVESVNHKIFFAEAHVQYGTTEWDRAMKARDVMFGLVAQDKYQAFSAAIWAILADTHHGWRSAATMDKKNAATNSQYYDRLVMDDLCRTLEILKKRDKSISQLELEAARHLWVTTLRYGESSEEISLANDCEKEYAKHFTWDFSGFFSWHIKEDVLSEMLKKIKGLFNSAESTKKIVDFFEDSMMFLRSRNPDSPDSDCGRSYDLAATCWDMYSSSKPNIFSRFVETYIKEPRGNNSFRDHFFVYFLRIWIREFKARNPTGNVVGEIKRLVGTAHGKEDLLACVYGGMCSKVLGRITCEELSYICSSDCNFSNRQLSCILPTFLSADADALLNRFGEILDGELVDRVELERDWWAFMVNCYLVILREDDKSVPNPISWLMESFSKYKINGTYLGSHELEYLVKHANFHFSQMEFASLMRRRNEIEMEPRPFPEYKIMPYEFDVEAWVSNDVDEMAIHDMCSLTLEKRTFLTVSYMPRYIALLDGSGIAVGSFVSKYLVANDQVSVKKLRQLGDLAAGYKERTDAWQKIVVPICHYMNETGVARSERYSVYQSFQPKMCSWSSVVGEVPSVFIEKEKSARQALEEVSADSDLYEYCVWAHNQADSELKAAQERAEEERHV